MDEKFIGRMEDMKKKKFIVAAITVHYLRPLCTFPLRPSDVQVRI